MTERANGVFNPFPTGSGWAGADLWDAEDGRGLGKLRHFHHGATSVDFRPDGQALGPQARVGGFGRGAGEGQQHEPPDAGLASGLERRNRRPEVGPLVRRGVGKVQPAG